MSTAAPQRRAPGRSPAHEGRNAPARPRRPQAVPGHARRRMLRVSTVSASLLALVVLFGLVGFHALIAENQARIDALDDAIRAADRDRQTLSRQVWDLERGDRIRREAIERLGMVAPEQVVQLDPIPDAELGDPVVAVVDPAAGDSDQVAADSDEAATDTDQVDADIAQIAADSDQVATDDAPTAPEAGG